MRIRGDFPMPANKKPSKKTSKHNLLVLKQLKKKKKEPFGL